MSGNEPPRGGQNAYKTHTIHKIPQRFLAVGRAYVPAFRCTCRAPSGAREMRTKSEYRL